MSESDRDDATIYAVVVNAEGQYSIWPVELETPSGWTPVGRTGSKAEALAYIADVWTDRRPASQRKRAEEA